MNWNKVKDEVEGLLQSAPQRGARAAHAIKQIEAGLAELAACGYSFEPQIKGLVAAVEAPDEPQTVPNHSIEQAVAQVVKPKLVQPSMVEHGGSETFQEASYAK